MVLAGDKAAGTLNANPQLLNRACFTNNSQMVRLLLDAKADRRATLAMYEGGKVTREAGPVKGGTTVIAFVEDPDGYKIELIERHSTRDAARP